MRLSDGFGSGGRAENMPSGSGGRKAGLAADGVQFRNNFSARFQPAFKGGPLLMPLLAGGPTIGARRDHGEKPCLGCAIRCGKQLGKVPKNVKH